ncbi:MAG: phytoene desaturase family protein [Candidatus Saccharimonadales bacterium]
MVNKPASQKTAVIIGAGIGGLGVAALLSADGWRVKVYEQAAGPGGRAGIWQKDGFRFDTGPSWYLMPEVFEHYFELLGEKRNDYFQLQKLSPAYKVFTETEAPIVVTGDIEQDSQTFDDIEAGAGNQLKKYLKNAEQTYNLAVKYFLYNPFRSIGPLLKIEIFKKLPFMLTQLLQPISSYVNKYVRRQVLQQILEYPMVFLGTSPYQAPALYHLMSHMDFAQGVFFPKGGMFKVIEAIESINKKRGTELNYNQSVSRIVYENKKATGVLLSNGDTVSADIVISNADLHFTETQLLAEEVQSYPEKFWSNKVAGPSALLMYLGVKGQLPELEHHNLLFAKAWEQNFKQIFESKVWPDKASMYISRTSASDKSTAPNDSQNIFVLVPLPAGHSEDLEQYAEKYLGQIESITGIKDFRERITLKRLYGPDDFTNDFNAWQGTALGMAHILKQSAMFRPAVKSKKLTNLYYVGGNTQPGIGLPMCLISAELVYKRLVGDNSAGPLESLGRSHG